MFMEVFIYIRMTSDPFFCASFLSLSGHFQRSGDLWHYHIDLKPHRACDRKALSFQTAVILIGSPVCVQVPEPRIECSLIAPVGASSPIILEMWSILCSFLIIAPLYLNLLNIA